MKIFKFGGASVKDADGVKNLLNVVNKKADKNTIIVVSAMGKTTNSLELVVKNYFENNEELQFSINEVLDYHLNILDDLEKAEKDNLIVDIEGEDDIYMFKDCLLYTSDAADE